ncbi:hypothetical protein K431DRAFT_288281 [Polychaeton citri CBS 116435]|uniref:Uncharacterized protein n=1 Tax=Polychaeton citri CBS 116435 TaxID=1314669 RepID=A0A9P4PZE2_9PEZI|nr:hypothetical protein K431DRAFT_288281 [Polychaeton citri CBS 116435]
MKGKVRPVHSRSDSGGSKPSVTFSQPVSRQVSQRVVQERVISGPSSINGVLQEQPEKLIPGTTKPSQGHRRQRSKTVGDSSKPKSAEALATRRPVSSAPMMHFTYSDNSQNSGTTIGRNSFLSPDEANNIHASRAGVQKVVLRPTLSPIASDSTTPAVKDGSSSNLPLPFTSVFNEKRASADGSAGMQQKRQRPPLYLNDSSLGVLEAYPSPSTGKSLAPSPTLVEANQRLPSPNQKEEEQLEEEYPEMFDSWYTPDFDLSSWVTEHTKREVRHRWSMDI